MTAVIATLAAGAVTQLVLFAFTFGRVREKLDSHERRIGTLETDSQEHGEDIAALQARPRAHAAHA